MEFEQIIDIEVETDDGKFTLTGAIQSVKPNKIVLAKLYGVDLDHPSFPFDSLDEYSEISVMLANQFLSYRLQGIGPKEAIVKTLADKDALIKLLG